MIKKGAIKTYIHYNESNAMLPKCRKNKIIRLRMPGAILGLNKWFGGRFSLFIGMLVVFRWEVTCNRWQVTSDKWQVTIDSCHEFLESSDFKVSIDGTVTCQRLQVRGDMCRVTGDRWQVFLWSFWSLATFKCLLMVRWHLKGYRVQVTGDTWQVTCDWWHVTLTLTL